MGFAINKGLSVMRVPIAVVLLCLPMTAFASEWSDCIKKADGDERFIKVCNKAQISKMDKQLDKAWENYGKFTNADKQVRIKDAKQAWNKYRNNFCDSYNHIVDTQVCWAALAEGQIKVLEQQTETQDSPKLSDNIQQTATYAGGGEWYQSTAEPSLTVRDSPNVTGAKVDNVPINGKVKVIKRTGKNDSIGGRSGEWVQIEWKNSTGFVFDAFLKSVDDDYSHEPQNSNVKIVTASNPPNNLTQNIDKTNKPNNIPDGMRSCSDKALHKKLPEITKKTLLAKLNFYAIKTRSVVFDSYDPNREAMYCRVVFLMSDGEDYDYILQQQIVDGELYLFVKPDTEDAEFNMLSF